MSRDKAYKLDITSLPAESVSDSPPDVRPNAPQTTGRPFLRIHFACCNAYSRIYRSAEGASYDGRCPRCARPVHFAVGEGGTDQRSFIVA